MDLHLRLSIKEYIKFLSNLFNPTEFFTHLCFVFTHSRFEDIEEEIVIMEKRKKSLIKKISNIVNDNANIKEKNIASKIKIYFIDIKKKYEHNNIKNKKAQETFDNIIEEIKLNSKKYPPINTENLVMKGEFEY